MLLRRDARTVPALRILLGVCVLGLADVGGTVPFAVVVTVAAVLALSGVAGWRRAAARGPLASEDRRVLPAAVLVVGVLLLAVAGTGHLLVDGVLVLNGIVLLAVAVPAYVLASRAMAAEPRGEQPGR